MSERLVLQPPEIVGVEGEVIFLGGPIQGAPLWHPQAAAKVHGIDKSIVIASPSKGEAPREYEDKEQIDWETHYLARAAFKGVVLFWLPEQVTPTPGRAYAQTSRFELGEWAAKHQAGSVKLVVGLEPRFGNAPYIRRRFGQDYPDVPILSNLDDTCESAVELIRGRD